MIGTTGTAEVDQFTFGVGFLVPPTQIAPDQSQGTLQIVTVQGLQFAGSAGLDVLIGRDIICIGAFSLSFDGHFILSL